MTGKRPIPPTLLCEFATVPCNFNIGQYYGTISVSVLRGLTTLMYTCLRQNGTVILHVVFLAKRAYTPIDSNLANLES